MKDTKIYSLVLAATLAVFSGCDSDFEEINKNPNNPEAVPASLLLPTVIRNTAYEIEDLAWNYGNVVVQYSAKIQFTNEDRYNWGPQSDPYNSFFNTLRDVNNIIRLSEETGENNYRGIALVMKSYMYHVMTDSYGDVPYSEALQAKAGENSPAFDEQETVYAGIIADLKEANEIIGTSEEAVRGDILFDGDLLRWRKFANSLRMRIHMRLSDRVDPSGEMQAILNDPDTYPLFNSNDDQAAFQFLQDSPNQQPRYTSRSGSYDEFRLSENMENTLKSLGDPRLFAYAQPTTDSEAGIVGTADDYEGVPNGLADEEALKYSPSGDSTKGGSNYLSRVGIMFACRACDPERASPVAAQVVLMSYAELQFILAEARERNLITSGEAETYYLNGIEASFDYYESRLEVGGYEEIAAVIQPDAAYYTQPSVAYSGTTEEKLAKIGTQKWIALFNSGMEGWFDWRRTGYPAVTPGPGAVIPTVPVRFQYPSSVQALNLESYQAAVARQGEDMITTRVWWDVD
jgi:hypothetical protein